MECYGGIDKDRSRQSLLPTPSWSEAPIRTDSNKPFRLRPLRSAIPARKSTGTHDPDGPFHPTPLEPQPLTRETPGTAFSFDTTPGKSI